MAIGLNTNPRLTMIPEKLQKQQDYISWLVPKEKEKGVKAPIHKSREELRHSHLEKLFKGVERCLDLVYNWDGQGSTPVSRATFNRAKLITSNLVTNLSFMNMPDPIIVPVPNGTIDINYHTTDYQILINIPETLDDYIEIYGKSIINPSANKLDTLTKNPETIDPVLKEWMTATL